MSLANMKYFTEECALSLLDLIISEGGVIQVDPSDYYWIKQEEQENVLEYRRAIAGGALHALHDYVSLRFQRRKVGFEEAFVGCFEGKLHFKVATILRVPGGVDGLKELRSFLDWSRYFFTEYKNDRPVIRITNNRSRSKCTYADLWALTWPIKDDSSVHIERHEKDLKQRIYRSTNLSGWFRNVALDLNILGPHSWMNIKSDHIFAERDDPIKQANYARIDAEIAAEEAAKAKT